MDFTYMDDDPDFHSVRLQAITLREAINRRDPERKRIMKEARLSGDTETHDLMRKLRPPAWYAVTFCSECPMFNLISSSTSMKNRFTCFGCGGAVSLEWTEEHARDKVHTMLETHIKKEVMKKEPPDSGWLRKAKALHAKETTKNGCKVRERSTCDWCDERLSNMHR